jgi:hypothetical protein
MKGDITMSKISKIVAALAVVPVLAFASPVFADSPGQFDNKDTNYQVRNMKDKSYSQSATAACDESVRYSVMAANADFGQLSDVTVKASLTSGNITVSAKNVADQTVSVSGKVTVTVPANGHLTYVNGSTVRINGDNTQRDKQADGVTNGGVNVGDLDGSSNIFVQFDAKVNCDTETPKEIKVCNLDTK